MAAGILLSAAGISPGQVLVPVTVVDPLNRLFTDLEPGALEIYEDNVKQKIVSFGREDAPLSIGIVLDASGSMGYEAGRSRQFVDAFFRTANPEDEAFLVEVGDRPQLIVPFTRHPKDIQDRLDATEYKGRTALLDGVYLALQAMEKASNRRKVLIVISDGYDNHSRYNGFEVGNRVKENDVQIYGIGIYDTGAARGRTPEELSGPERLRSLSEPTGGRYFIVENLSELPDIAAKIGIELRSQYIVGYSPANQVRDGKYRKITVKLIQPLNQPRGFPTLHAYWRTGYFAPTQ